LSPPRNFCGIPYSALDNRTDFFIEWKFNTRLAHGPGARLFHRLSIEKGRK
jgi:hypothetical protein